MQSAKVEPRHSLKLPAKQPSVQDSFIIDTRGDLFSKPLIPQEEELGHERIHALSFNLLVEREPKSEEEWLDHLTELPLSEKISSADRALHLFPHSTKLMILRMQAASQLHHDPKPLLLIWQQVVEAYSKSLDVWKAFLRWYEGCSLFHFDQYLSYLRICLYCFLNDSEFPSIWSTIVKVLWDAGYTEKAIAIIQACWGKEYTPASSPLERTPKGSSLINTWLWMERMAERDFLPAVEYDEADYARFVLKEDVDPFIIPVDRETILCAARSLCNIPRELLVWMAKDSPPCAESVTILLEAGENPKELLKPFRSDPKHPAWLAYARHLQMLGIELDKARQILDFQQPCPEEDWKAYALYERLRGSTFSFRSAFGRSRSESAIPVAIDFELGLSPPFHSEHRIRSLFHVAVPTPDLWLKWIKWEVTFNPPEARRLLFQGATRFAASKTFLLAALEFVPVTPFEFANLITNAESRGLRMRTMLEEIAPLEDFCKSS